MEHIQGVSVWKGIREELIKQNKTIGFVPTMGALHQGHGSLIKRSAKENDVTVVSVFVNPTQFNDPNDLKKYPRTIEQDLNICREMGANYVIEPSVEEMYGDHFRYLVSEKEMSRILEGQHRPGHFDGVLTVVMKLLNIVSPTRAYFGEKDFQQLSLVQDMVKAFFMRVEIVPCPTVREESGLAMSSRNSRLSQSEKELAAQLNQFLRSKKTDDDVVRDLQNLGFKVDYVSQWQNRRLAAVHLGAVRLIDNVEI